MEKKLSNAQKEFLQQKVLEFNLAKKELNEFIQFLYKELDIDAAWQLSNDLSNFSKIDEPKEEEQHE